MKTTQAYLKECFDYNPETGELRWSVRPLSHFVAKGRNHTPEGCCLTWNKKHAGTSVKWKTPWGRQHQVIWALVYGKWLVEIDHANGNCADNSLRNLQNGSHAENMRNATLRIDSKTGTPGVHYRQGRTNPYSVNIGAVRVGSFKLKEDAIAARKAAELKYGFHINHGRQKGAVPLDCKAPTFFGPFTPTELLGATWCKPNNLTLQPQL